MTLSRAPAITLFTLAVTMVLKSHVGASKRSAAKNRLIRKKRGKRFGTSAGTQIGAEINRPAPAQNARLTQSNRYGARPRDTLAPDRAKKPPDTAAKNSKVSRAGMLMCYLTSAMTRTARLA